MNRYQVQFEQTKISFYEIEANSEAELRDQLADLSHSAPWEEVELDGEYHIVPIETDS